MTDLPTLAEHFWDEVLISCREFPDGARQNQLRIVCSDHNVLESHDQFHGAAMYVLRYRPFEEKGVN